MRRVLLLSLLFILLVGACAPAAATEAPADVTGEPTSSPEAEEPTAQPVSLGPAEEAVIKQLAENLSLEESDISLVSSEEAEFGDACLDVEVEGMLCAQVITPGHVIVLEADGIRYTYHTSEDGSRIQPATPALAWKREGGIAGFCDVLTVFRSGEVFTSNCKSDGEGKMGTFANLLSSEEVSQFNDWMSTFGDAELDASDPKGVADRMVVTLEVLGSGDESPTEAEQQELFEFAQDLYTKSSR
ncbi:MAG TPA: hypothetical protein VK897_11750 [Anaerolineales bacterium]|nr:hypothetical protein [Anaerolineales bacterium]